MRQLLSAIVVSALSVGCAIDATAESASARASVQSLDSITHLERRANVPVLPKPRKALATDYCDEPTFMTTPWIEKVDGNITYRFAAGSAAERDLVDITDARRKRYDEIAEFFGVTAPVAVKIVLSPNRLAAVKHGYGLGWSVLSKSTAEVVYTGDEGSFEKRSPGHELAHVVGSKVDGALYHMPFLDEGVAELLDGSGRDLHASYINEIRASYNTVSVTRLTSNDVNGGSYGRAGSFVQFLVDRYGKEKLVELWKTTSVTWSGSTFTTKLGDRVKTAAELELALDRALRGTYGAGFEEIREAWEEALAPYFATPSSVDAEDADQIKAVLAHADEAINTADASALRSTMEGYYCDWYSDADKLATATAAVEYRGVVRTEVMSIISNNHRNFPEVVVHALHTEVRDGVETKSAKQIWMEKLPVGWRVTSAVW
jgi:hypothetical protein